MTRVVLVDTGPLVALVNRRDRWHPWTVEAMGAIPIPLITCEAVTTEASYLLGRASVSADALLEATGRRAVSIQFMLSEELTSVRRLMKRCGNLPMPLADACLVRTSELFSDSAILTLDRDVSAYRRDGRQHIPLIAPFA